MFRVILSLILVANVVACPLRCTFCQVSGLRGEMCAQEAGVDEACPCCRAERDLQPPLENDGQKNHGQDEGNLPGDDCHCQNCLCAGATLSNAPKLPGGDHHLVDWIHCSLTDCKITDLFGRAASAPFSDRALATISVRDLRIAHQCWLI